MTRSQKNTSHTPIKGIAPDPTSSFKGSFPYPDLWDLTSNLRFSPSTGRLWLVDQRMLMMHADAFSVMRRDLIENMGQEKARRLMTRVGYLDGHAAAELVRNTIRPELTLAEIFAGGPQLRAIEGFIGSVPLFDQIECDVERGTFYCEAELHESVEAELHLQTFGIGNSPACWMTLGFASGYMTSMMGKPVLWREEECRAKGNDRCKIVGKVLSDWDDPSEDLRYLDFDAFAKNTTDKPTGSNTRKMESVYTPVITERGQKTGYDVVGSSAGFTSAMHNLKKAAPTLVTVLLEGESGVGKEVFARTLHKLSPRAEAPFIAINCAAIPDNLIEAELFGVEKGAFTGAVASRPGRFELADGGSLFLDEVGELSPSAQGKLLRALQEQEIERVGGVKTKRVDVRVIAATNVKLLDAVAKGEFRQDLYYRLNVFPIKIPPLRERRADIPLLIDLFFRKLCDRHDKALTGFTEKAIAILLDYHWPGNVRELENIIERGVILAPNDGAIDIEHLDSERTILNSDSIKRASMSIMKDGSVVVKDDTYSISSSKDDQHRMQQWLGSLLQDGESLPSLIDRIENLVIDEAITQSDGNLSAAAKMLGFTRAQIAYRVEKRKAD